MFSWLVFFLICSRGVPCLVFSSRGSTANCRRARVFFFFFAEWRRRDIAHWPEGEGPHPFRHITPVSSQGGGGFTVSQVAAADSKRWLVQEQQVDADVCSFHSHMFHFQSSSPSRWSALARRPVATRKGAGLLFFFNSTVTRTSPLEDVVDSIVSLSARLPNFSRLSQFCTPIGLVLGVYWKTHFRVVYLPRFAYCLACKDLHSLCFWPVHLALDGPCQAAG